MVARHSTIVMTIWLGFIELPKASTNFLGFHHLVWRMVQWANGAALMVQSLKHLVGTLPTLGRCSNA